MQPLHSELQKRLDQKYTYAERGAGRLDRRPLMRHAQQWRLLLACLLLSLQQPFMRQSLVLAGVTNNGSILPRVYMVCRPFLHNTTPAGMRTTAALHLQGPVDPTGNRSSNSRVLHGRDAAPTFQTAAQDATICTATTQQMCGAQHQPTHVCGHATAAATGTYDVHAHAVHDSRTASSTQVLRETSTQACLHADRRPQTNY